jgi:hypothetical protein
VSVPLVRNGLSPPAVAGQVHVYTVTAKHCALIPPVVVQGIVGHAEQLVSLTKAVPGTVVARVQRNS